MDPIFIMVVQWSLNSFSIELPCQREIEFVVAGDRQESVGLIVKSKYNVVIMRSFALHEIIVW